MPALVVFIAAMIYAIYRGAGLAGVKMLPVKAFYHQ